MGFLIFIASYYIYSYKQIFKICLILINKSNWHKTKKNKFFRLWRYSVKIQLYNICILCNVWLKIVNYILRWSNSNDQRSDRFKCIWHSMEALRMSDIRHSTDDQYRIENRIYFFRSIHFSWRYSIASIPCL